MMMIMMNKMAPFWPYKKGPESRKDPVYDILRRSKNNAFEVIGVHVKSSFYLREIAVFIFLGSLYRMLLSNSHQEYSSGRIGANITYEYIVRKPFGFVPQSLLLARKDAPRRLRSPPRYLEPSRVSGNV